MRVVDYIKPVDSRAVAYHLAGATSLLGMVLLPTVVVSALFGEHGLTLRAAVLSLGAVAAGFGVRRLGAFAGKNMDLGLAEALVVTALVYLLFSLISALLYLPEKPFVDALFETMSGFTTTGLSLFDERTMPLSLHFFRAFAQWIGGLGIIVLSLAVLLGPGKAAFQLYDTEFGQENIVGSVVGTAKVVVRVYLALTAAGYLAFLLAGMGAFDGLIHAFTTISTGGFALYPDSIGHYRSTAVELTVVLFMLLSAVSFPLYYLIFRRGPGSFLRDRQVQALAAMLLAWSSVFFIGFGKISGFSVRTLVDGLFQAATAITTTGFSSVPTGGLSPVHKLVTVLLMIAGGSTGSTAGGIKLLRLLVLIGVVRAAVVRPVLPRDAEIPLGIRGLKVSRDEAETVLAFFVLYLFVLAGSTLILLWIEGGEILDTLFEVASAEGTVGLSVGIASQSLHPASKLVLIANMWFGRLEILPVLVALNPALWIKTIRSARDRRSEG